LFLLFFLYTFLLLSIKTQFHTDIMRIVNVTTISHPKSDPERQQHPSECDVVYSNDTKDSGTKKLVARFERSPLRNGSPSIASMIRQSTSTPRNVEMNAKQNGQQNHSYKTQMHLSPNNHEESSITPNSNGSAHLYKSLALGELKKSHDTQSSSSRENTLPCYTSPITSMTENQLKPITGSLKNSPYNVASSSPDVGSSSTTRIDETKKIPATPLDIGGDVPKKPSDYKRNPLVLTAGPTVGKVDVNLGIPSLQSQVDPKAKINQERAPPTDSHTMQYSSKSKSRENSLMPSNGDSSSSMGTNAVPMRTSWKKAEGLKSAESPSVMVYRDESNLISKKPSSYKASPTFTTTAHHPEKDEVSVRLSSLSTTSNSASKYSSNLNSRVTKTSSPSRSLGEMSEGSRARSAGPFRTSWKKSDGSSQTIESPSTPCSKESNETPKSHLSSYNESPSYTATTRHSNKVALSIGSPTLSNESKIDPIACIGQERAQANDSNNKATEHNVEYSGKLRNIADDTLRKNTDGQTQTVESPYVVVEKDSNSNKTPKKTPPFAGRPSFINAASHPERVHVSLRVPSLSDESQVDEKARIDEDSVSSSFANKASQLSRKRESGENGSVKTTAASASSSYEEKVAGSKPPPMRSSLTKSDSPMQTIESPSHLVRSDSECNETTRKPASYKEKPKDNMAAQQPDKVVVNSLRGPSISSNQTQMDLKVTINDGISPNSIPMRTTWKKSDGQNKIVEPQTDVISRGSERHETPKKHSYRGSPSVTTVAQHPDKVTMNLGVPSLLSDRNNVLQYPSKWTSREIDSGFEQSSLHTQNRDTSTVFTGQATLPVEASTMRSAALEFSEINIEHHRQTKAKENHKNVVTPESMDGKSPSMSLSSASPTGDTVVHFEVNFDEDPLACDFESVGCSSKQPESVVVMRTLAGDDKLQFEVNFDEEPSLNRLETVDKSSNLGNSSEPKQRESIEKTEVTRIAVVLPITGDVSKAFDDGSSSLNLDDGTLLSLQVSEESIVVNQSVPSSQLDSCCTTDASRQDLVDGSVCRQDESPTLEEMSPIYSPGDSTSSEIGDRSSSPSRLSVRSKVSKFDGVTTSTNSTATPTRKTSDSISTLLHRSPARVPFNIPNLHLDLASSSWRDFRLHLLQLADRPEWIMPALTRFHPENGASPLHTAVWKAPTALTLMLIQLLSSADDTLEVFSSRDRDGNTALHLVCANLSVSKDSMTELDLSAFEELLKHSCHLCQLQNNQGDSPLHLLVSSVAARSDISAVQEEIYRAVHLMLDSSPEKVALLRIRDQSGATPLHTAISSGANQSIILRLLDLEPTVAKMDDERGLIPLHYAAALSRVISPLVVKALIHAYEMGIFHKVSRSGDIPIHLAISNFSTLPESSASNSEKAIGEIFTHLMGPSFPLSEGGMDQLQSTLLTTNIDKVRLMLVFYLLSSANNQHNFLISSFLGK
jgi:hypothetical protein